MCILYMFSYVAVVSFIPIIAIHVEGQFQILCKHLELMGHPHRNPEGKQIFYTDFETDQYVLVSDVLRHIHWEGRTDYVDSSPKTNSNGRQQTAISKNNNDMPVMTRETHHLVATKQNCWMNPRRSDDSMIREHHALGQLDLGTIKEKTLELKPAGGSKIGCKSQDELGQHDLATIKEKALEGKPAGDSKMGCKSSGQGDLDLEENYWKVLPVYERHYFKQLVKFHQKLLKQIEQMMIDISELVLLMVVGNYLIASLALYQLTFQTETTSMIRLFKFLVEYILVLIQFYTYCNAAESLDDNQSNTRNSVYFSAWYRLCPSVRRDMCVLLSRLLKSNHPSFFHGVIVLQNNVLTRLLKVSYQVVNLMRLKSARV
uniref:Odorant receptor n=1 Tax=Cacopsylla melanoneura TaxID=428564 RepID=A0A8D9E892_9HEMI